MTSLLAFCVTNKFSGGEKYTVDLLYTLQQRGWNVALVGDNNSILEAACTAKGIRYVDSLLGPKLSRTSAFQVLLTWTRKRSIFFKLISREKPDVILLQYKLEQLLWAGRRVEAKVLLLEHGPIPVWILRLRPLRMRYRASAKNADKLFAASGPAQKAFNAFGVDSTILRAGIDDKAVSQARGDSATTRQRMNRLSPATRIGIYAGRLTEDKGIVIAAEAVAQLSDVCLFIAGGGPAESRLREIAASHPNIVILGSLVDPLPYIAAADFGVLLTTDAGEGRPLFAIECLALGTPVIGLSTSAAMKSLQDEYGDCVHLLRRDEFGGLERLLRTVPRVSVPTSTWTAAAEIFDKELSLTYES